MNEMADFQDSRAQRGEYRGDRSNRRAGFEVVLRRFFREVQQSRILSEVKKRRYRDKDVSRQIRRKAAIRKAARKRVRRGY